MRILPLGTASGALLSVAAVAGLLMLAPAGAHAQWWRSAPADFEDCADTAEKSATKEARKAALSECNAKFAGRRKPGGGYSYFDFMQNRNFDIAGPNPTAEERELIDGAYMGFLDAQAREAVVSAQLARRQNEQLRADLESARQPVERRQANELACRVHAQLAVDVRSVGLDGLHADRQRARHRLVGEAAHSTCGNGNR